MIVGVSGAASKPQSLHPNRTFSRCSKQIPILIKKDDWCN